MYVCVCVCGGGGEKKTFNPNRDTRNVLKLVKSVLYSCC